jgi:2'-5' RNA ligase
VEGGERLRLFVALPLPGSALERLAAWQREALAGARAARIVPPANLHVTLAFLGHRPAGEVDGILAELRAAAERARRPALRALR